MRLSSLGEWTLLGCGAAAVLLSNDMRQRGFPKYAMPTLAVGVAVAGLGVLGHVLHINWKSTTTSRDTAHTNEPIPVDVVDGDHAITTLRPGPDGLSSFSVGQYLGSLGSVRTDWQLTARIPDSSVGNRRFTLKADVVAHAVEEQKAESLRAAEAESVEAAREAAEERARRIAEERRGTLIGAFPNARNIPSGCQTARIVDEGVIGSAASVLANDMWNSFPELASRCKTELEKESFLTTAEADSYRTLIRKRKSELTRGMLAFQISEPRILDYDVERGEFPIRLGEVTSMVGYGMQEAENEYGRGLAAHVVEGVWFDDLPLRAITLLGTAVTQYLDIKVSSRERALDIERTRDSLQIWVAFRLTGNVRRLSRPNLPIFENEVKKFPEATDPIVMLVDVSKGDVVWAK